MFNFDEKFWLAIAFLAFIALLIKFAKTSIVNAINQKANDITKAISDAKKAKEGAEKLLKDVLKYQEESKIFAQKLISDAKKEAEEIAKIAKQELELEIAKKTHATLSRIQSEEEATIREFKQNIIKTTISNLEKNFTKDLKDEEQKNLFTKLNGELAQILK